MVFSHSSLVFRSMIVFSGLLIYMVGSLSCAIHQQAWAKPSSTEQIKSAQDAILMGQQLLRNKKYVKAITYFKRSHQLAPDVKNLMTIGAIYSKVNQCSESYTAWRRAQVFCKMCSLRKQIEASLKKSTKQCTGLLKVTAMPRAEVRLDGLLVGMTPLSTPVLIGSHYLEVSSPGYEMSKQRIVIERLGQEHTEDFTLDLVGQSFNRSKTLTPKNSEQRATPPPLSKKEQDHLDFTQKMNAAPSHFTSNQGRMSWFDKVQVEGSKERTVTRNSLLGVGVLSLLTSVTFAYFMFDDYNDVKRRVESRQIKQQEQIDQADFHMYSNLSIGFGVLSFLTSSTGLYLLFF